ncbi:hypothetical protein IC611_16580 [Proteus mirabilis]
MIKIIVPNLPKASTFANQAYQMNVLKKSFFQSMIRLIAVNAQTGNACRDFGQNGEINLLASMPYAYLGGYNPTSPPIVTGNTIIIGGSVTDNLSTQEPSGVIRGYDINSGKLIWVFDTGAEDPNAMPGKETQFVHNSLMHGRL